MRFLLLGLLLFSSSVKAAEFEVLEDHYKFIVMRLSGLIDERDDEKFEKFVYANVKYGQKRYLVLHSKGGDYWASKQIGEIVHRFGITTTIRKGGKCVSGCALIFIAGWDEYDKRPSRLKHTQSKLGVHHPFDVKQKKHSNKFIMKDYWKYVYNMKGGLKFYLKSQSTPASNMYYFQNRELAKMGGYQLFEQRTISTLNNYSSQ